MCWSPASWPRRLKPIKTASSREPSKVCPYSLNLAADIAKPEAGTAESEMDPTRVSGKLVVGASAEQFEMSPPIVDRIGGASGSKT